MTTNSVEYFKAVQYRIPEQILSPIIIAWKLQTPENYGNLIRLADTVGAAKVLFVDSGIELSQRKIRKTAGNSYKTIEFCFIPSEELWGNLPGGYELVALETAAGSENIFKTKLPSNLALLVGSENAGIDQDFLRFCDKVVHIPLTGNCTSLNVSHATAIALFEWLRQVLPD